VSCSSMENLAASTLIIKERKWRQHVGSHAKGNETRRMREGAERWAKWEEYSISQKGKG
jgi:hypothetical protein